jgi:hypothetical protein
MTLFNFKEEARVNVSLAAVVSPKFRLQGINLNHHLDNMALMISTNYSLT